VNWLVLSSPPLFEGPEVVFFLKLGRHLLLDCQFTPTGFNPDIRLDHVLRWGMVRRTPSEVVPRLDQLLPSRDRFTWERVFVRRDQFTRNPVVDPILSGLSGGFVGLSKRTLNLKRTLDFVVEQGHLAWDGSCHCNADELVGITQSFEAFHLIYL